MTITNGKNIIIIIFILSNLLYTTQHHKTGSQSWYLWSQLARRSRGRRVEQLPGVGDRWHCRRRAAAAAVPSVRLRSRCALCRTAIATAEERAPFPLLYFFPGFYPRPILFARATSLRPSTIRCCLPVASSSPSPFAGRVRDPFRFFSIGCSVHLSGGLVFPKRFLPLILSPANPSAVVPFAVY